MIATSMLVSGNEHIATPRPVEYYATGGCTAMPLLYPWANRLDRHEYTFGSDRVAITPGSVHTDRNGLPIHGTLHARPFEIIDSKPNSLTAGFVFDAPELLASFPFPHDLAVHAEIAPETATLRITTTVCNRGRKPMPISFGWHPFFRLGSTPRSSWELRIPECEQHELDALLIPTGRLARLDASQAPIGDRTYDDHFSLGADRTFTLADHDQRITITFDEHYPHSQIYLPGPDASLTGDFVCIEPMTAISNALGAGAARQLAGGETFGATFSICVTDLATL